MSWERGPYLGSIQRIRFFRAGRAGRAGRVFRGIPRQGLRRLIIGGYTVFVSPSFLNRTIVSSEAVQPGARLVWCLKRRTTDVQCVLSQGMPVEVRVIHGRDVVVTEMFQEEQFALSWARSFERQLRDKGWEDSPASRAS